MAFIEQQGNRRLINKAWDFATPRKAMHSKIRDVKKSLQLNRRQRAVLRSQYFRLVNGKGYKVRKIMNKIKLKQNNMPDYKKKVISNVKKIAHLEHVLTEKTGNKNQTNPRPTLVSYRLKEYSELPIFGTLQDLPPKQELTGPYICDDRIQLNKQELSILSKDPKFSIMEECSESAFKLELEKMLAKNRFNDQNKNVRESITDENKQILTRGTEEEDDNKLLWEKVSHRYIHDPFERINIHELH